MGRDTPLTHWSECQSHTKPLYLIPTPAEVEVALSAATHKTRIGETPA